MITSDHDFERMKGKQNIYIYGAGNMADAVYGHLAGDQCAVKGFVVSRTLNNPDRLKGLPVVLAYDIPGWKEDVCVVVAVMPVYRKEVVDLLLQLGFCNIITLSDAYANELKERRDRGFLDRAGYGLEFPGGIERGHGILIKRESACPVKLRVDMRMFGYLRQAALAGNWQDDGPAEEYGRLFGRGETVLKSGNSGHDGAGVAERAEIYAVKCHVDKPLGQSVPCGYLKEIQAGADLTDRRLCGCLDNTGENISSKNRDFSECSAIYWAWKNGERKEYTGIYHYRRHLDVPAGELLRLMDKGTTLINTVPCLMYPSNKYFFITKFLYEYDWLLMMQAVRRLEPAYYETARAFERGHFYLANNIFVMKTEWFDRMCRFVFSILLEIDRVYGERHIERQDRYAGYLFEVLYSIFVMHHAADMRIAYADMLFLN